MALQTGRDIFGLAKQSARGVLAASPAIIHGLTGGGTSVDPKQEPIPITSAALAPSSAFRERIEAESEIETLALSRSIGHYLLAALGSVATTGSSATYTHTFTLGQATPYYSTWIKKGDGAIVASRDCKLDELALEWSENKPLEMKVKLPGGKVSFPASMTGTVDETVSPEFFTPVNGTFAVSASGSTPAAAAVLSGGLTIKRGVDSYFFSGDIEAGDNAEGVCEAEVKLKILPQDTSFWRTIVTGTAAGTSISQVPTYGSFEFNFSAGASTVRIAAPRVAFSCDLPDADPDGGAAELELSGIAYLSGATPITVTLVNTHASY